MNPTNEHPVAEKRAMRVAKAVFLLAWSGVWLSGALTLPPDRENLGVLVAGGVIGGVVWGLVCGWLALQACLHVLLRRSRNHI